MTRDPVAEAVEWQLRLAQADEDGWTAFVAWLEADAAHRAAYDEVCLTDAAAREALRPTPVAANDAGPSRRGRLAVFGGGAVAAVALVAMVALHEVKLATPVGSTVVAPSDAPSTVAISRDVRATLVSRGSKLRFDPANPRLAALENGSARFVVRHDPAHPFRLELGGHALVDVGTVFTVENGARIAIAVTRGAVTFDPGRADVTVRAAQRLVYDRAADTATLSDDPATPTAAHPASLSFVDAPLSDVTTAVGRASGARITLDPALSGRRFTGVIRLMGSAARDVPHFAEATGTASTRDGDQWRIGPVGEASR